MDAPMQQWCDFDLMEPQPACAFQGINHNPLHDLAGLKGSGRLQKPARRKMVGGFSFLTTAAPCHGGCALGVAASLIFRQS